MDKSQQEKTLLPDFKKLCSLLGRNPRTVKQIMMHPDFPKPIIVIGDKRKTPIYSWPQVVRFLENAKPMESRKAFIEGMAEKVLRMVASGESGMIEVDEYHASNITCHEKNRKEIGGRILQ